MIKEFIQFAYDGIRARRMRSWLTMLGIFIGVALVVALISLSQGLKAAITDQFEGLGSDLILIEPGTGFFGSSIFGTTDPLTEDDLEVIEGTRGVDAVTGYIFTFGPVEYKGEIKYPSVIGIEATEDARKIFGTVYEDVYLGRFLEESDNGKVIIGYSLAHEEGIFEDEIKVRDKVEILGEKFQVVGVMNQIGNPQDDNSLLITLDSARDLMNEPEKFDSLAANVKSGFDVDAVVEDIEDNLRKYRKVDEDEEDFTISTTAQLLESFDTILNIVQLILIGIASISIIVGMVGIMNTMFTAVLQRTREIGVMKAIGARNNHILLIFLIESGFYGIVGGAIGIIAGTAFAKVTELIAAPYIGLGLFEVKISLALILATLAGSFVVGALSGIAPAVRASKLQPTEALRYE